MSLVSPTVMDDDNECAAKDDNFLYIWHFDMLHDRERNEAYDAALRYYLQKSDVTSCVDIGTGSGFLGLLCAKYGAKKVDLFEAVPELAGIASQNVLENHFVDSVVRVQEMHSTRIGNIADAGKRYDLLVCELLDTGLIGEGPLSRYMKTSMV